MKKSILLAFFLVSTALFSQKTVSEFSEAIEDNSFLIEEAYNQEKGVVQHISNLQYMPDSLNPAFQFAFTQEWPFMSQTHQFSYTIPFASIMDGKYSGIGDIMLNYRYQLTGHDDFITIAPRFSLILPTGDELKELGNGVTGFEVNIPMSKRIHEYFSTHVNIGLKYFPGIAPSHGQYTYDQSTFYGGASLIYLPTYNLNFMCEALYLQTNNKYSTGLKSENTTFILNPGVRYAWDIGELQIVPGFSMPLVFEKAYNNSEFDNMKANYFFYLSFEHPF